MPKKTATKKGGLTKKQKAKLPPGLKKAIAKKGAK